MSRSRFFKLLFCQFGLLEGFEQGFSKNSIPDSEGLDQKLPLIPIKNLRKIRLAFDYNFYFKKDRIGFLWVSLKNYKSVHYLVKSSFPTEKYLGLTEV